MVRIWAGTVLAVVATLACGVAGDAGRRDGGGTSNDIFHQDDEVATLVLTAAANVSVGPGPVPTDPQGEMRHLLANAVGMILDQSMMAGSPVIRVSMDGALLSDLSSEVHMEVAVYLPFPSNASAASVQHDIESNAAALNAFRAAITVCAEAVFADRADTAVECGTIAVGHAIALPEDLPEAANSEDATTRALSFFALSRALRSINGGDGHDDQNHWQVSFKLSPGSELVLVGTVAVVIVLGVLTTAARRLRSTMSKV